jgi:hypothetical protein
MSRAARQKRENRPKFNILFLLSYAQPSPAAQVRESGRSHVGRSTRNEGRPADQLRATEPTARLPATDFGKLMADDTEKRTKAVKFAGINGD